jgi:hypothetical protein
MAVRRALPRSPCRRAAVVPPATLAATMQVPPLLRDYGACALRSTGGLLCDAIRRGFELSYRGRIRGAEAEHSGGSDRVHERATAAIIRVTQTPLLTAGEGPQRPIPPDCCGWWRRYGRTCWSGG